MLKYAEKMRLALDNKMKICYLYLQEQAYS